MELYLSDCLKTKEPVVEFVVVVWMDLFRQLDIADHLNRRSRGF